jgi:hypothetical protein
MVVGKITLRNQKLFSIGIISVVISISSANAQYSPAR